MGYSHFVGFANSLRQNPAPGNGETISIDTQLFHQLNILKILFSVILIDSHISGLFFANGKLGNNDFIGEEIPFTFALPFCLISTFNLVSSTGNSPQKVFWSLKL